MADAIARIIKVRNIVPYMERLEETAEPALPVVETKAILLPRREPTMLLYQINPLIIVNNRENQFGEPYYSYQYLNILPEGLTAQVQASPR
jgi:hypothetical protein